MSKPDKKDWRRICPECRGMGGHAPACPDAPESDTETVEALSREEVADIRNAERDDR